MFKNKKGFTLVELVVTIAIMLAIVGIAVPSAINMTNKSKQRSYELQVKEFETAAESYVLDNKSKWNISNIEGKNYCFTLDDLDDANYIKEIPKNSITGEKFTGSVNIGVTEKTTPEGNTVKKLNYTYSENECDNRIVAADLTELANYDDYLKLSKGGDGTPANGGDAIDVIKSVSDSNSFIDGRYMFDANNSLNYSAGKWCDIIDDNGKEYCSFVGYNRNNYLKIPGIKYDKDTEYTNQSGEDILWRVISTNDADNEIRIITDAAVDNSTYNYYGSETTYSTGDNDTKYDNNDIYLYTEPQLVKEDTVVLNKSFTGGVVYSRKCYANHQKIFEEYQNTYRDTHMDKLKNEIKKYVDNKSLTSSNFELYPNAGSNIDTNLLKNVSEATFNSSWNIDDYIPNYKRGGCSNDSWCYIYNNKDEKYIVLKSKTNDNYYYIDLSVVPRTTDTEISSTDKNYCSSATYSYDYTFSYKIYKFSRQHYTQSSILNTLNNWYDTNISNKYKQSNSNIFKNSRMCFNNENGAVDSLTNSYRNAYNGSGNDYWTYLKTPKYQTINSKSILDCSYINSATKKDYSVGLMSMAEFIFMGGSNYMYKDINDATYNAYHTYIQEKNINNTMFRNNNKSFWTNDIAYLNSTQATNNTETSSTSLNEMFAVGTNDYGNNGRTNSYNVKKELGVRPLMTLRGDVKLKGSGTANDPWIVCTDGSDADECK